MTENNENQRSKDHDTSTDTPDEEASRGQDIDAGGFPSSPGSDETPQETSTEESSSAPKPQKESDKSAEKDEEPTGSPYQGEDDDE